MEKRLNARKKDKKVLGVEASCLGSASIPCRNFQNYLLWGWFFLQYLPNRNDVKVTLGATYDCMVFANVHVSLQDP